MEKRDKNLVSGLLLLVGVVFILIAGSIFVTTAWQYLPEAGKRFLLFAVAAGLLSASVRLLRTDGMEQAGIALFYLGVGFCGFFVVSFLGGFYWGITEGCHRLAAGRLFAAHLVMFFLSGVLLVRRRKRISLGMTVLLLDGCLFWGWLAASLRYDQLLLLLAGMLLLFSLGDAAESVWGDRQAAGDVRALRDTYMALWVLHVVALCWMTLLEGVIGDFCTGEGVLFFLLLSVSSTVTYRARKMVGLRVTNSVLLFLTVYAGLRDVRLLCQRYQIAGWTEWETALAAFVVNFGLMLWMKRREMKTFLVLAGEALAFTQPYVAIPLLFRWEWRCALLCAGIVLLGYIWYDTWREIRWIRFILICQQLLALLLHDLSGGKLENVLILGVTGLVMLLAASVFRRKEYVIASSVLLLLIALYLTRGVWLSIAWWVYLLVAGIVLIVVALRWER